jgi:cytochrome c1
VDVPVTRPSTPRRTALVRAAILSLVVAGACRQGSARAQHQVEGGDAARGRTLIGAYGCGGCHDIPGVPGANATVGPPLDAYAERAYIAGALENRPEALVRWIMNPQAIEPGTAMPYLGVKEDEARDMAAYLYTLQRSGLGPPHLIPAWVIEH